MVSTKDESITGDVRSALGASPRVQANGVKVHTDRGWVRLEGIVGTLEEKAVAQEIAAGTQGVKAVENDLVVSSDGTVPDLEMERDARDKLDREGLEGIGVKVEAGNVFLMGVIASRSIEEQATSAVRSVKGIRGVVSELQIAAGEPVDDVTLANDVAEALSDDPRMDTMNLSVRADSGAILMHGQVTGERQLALATEIAKGVPGVKYVKSHLKVGQVEPWQ